MSIRLNILDNRLSDTASINEKLNIKTGYNFFRLYIPLDKVFV